MDGGQILAQTPLPGVPIPFPDSIKVPELRNYAGQLGAEMLVQSLREGLFVPPVTDYSSQAAQALEHRGRTPRHARKLGLEDKHIRWGAWTSDEILRRGRTLGALWSNITVPAFNQAGQQVWGTHKVIWTGHFERLDPQVPREEAQRYIEPGIPYATWDKSALMINTVDGMTLKTKALTVPGGKRGGVPQMIAKYSLVDPADQEGDGGVLYYPGWNVLT
ncbi:Methionyl-tRNA formyltransferase [Thelotrema lepadinum]|nr:Methionyl-tRNA formyltransferase [Thelotrema lepadinum]